MFKLMHLLFSEILKRKPVLFFLVLSLIPTSSSQAGYMNQYSEWKNQSLAVKIGYVMGVFDAASTVIVNGGQDAHAEAAGFSSCVSRLRITAQILAETIDAAYARTTKSWGYPPSVVLRNELLAPCKGDINRERRSLGLTPFSKD